jgi:CRISPR-associated protein Cas2
MNTRHSCGNNEKAGDDVLVLVTYDVNTESESGKKRLRKVAKQCVNYGQRVQNSVFECVVDAAQLRLLRDILEGIIDKEKDSLRFYMLGNDYKNKVIHIGAKESFDLEGPLLF